MTHIYRPRERKRDPLEHARQYAFPVPALPESRMSSTRLDKLQKPRVGHVVRLDGEGIDTDTIRGKLVVPPEDEGCPVNAERGDA